MAEIASEDGVEEDLASYLAEPENHVALFVDTPDDLAQIISE